MRTFAFIALALVVTGCAETPERPRTEDSARIIAPLPACLVQLDAGTKPGKDGKKPPSGVTRALHEEQIWPLVFPGYDATNARVPEGAEACNGRVPDLKGGHPAKIDEGAILMGGGSDRLKIAWLRSHTYDDGTTGGALALLRGLEGTAEVYAVGSYRARGKTQLSIERIGKEVVATATDDNCTGHKAGTGCETVVSVYLPRFGVMQKVATIATERITYETENEPAIRGKSEYRLTSAISYYDGGIRVLEQVMVRDEQNREVRKAELERAFTFAPDGSMVVDEDSLWSRVTGKAVKAKSPTASKETTGDSGSDKP